MDRFDLKRQQERLHSALELCVQILLQIFSVEKKSIYDSSGYKSEKKLEFGKEKQQHISDMEVKRTGC